METVAFKIVTDEAQASALWNEFSYKETLFDLWQLRYCYYKYNKFPLYFIVGEINGQAIGLLPLQFNTSKNFHEFFGGFWMEDNKVFLKEGFKEYGQQFYDQIPSPVKLVGIHQEDDYVKQMLLDGYKYQLDIRNFNSIEDYINDKFDHDARHKFKKKVRNADELNIQLLMNQSGDIELLFEYNKVIFGDESSFHDPVREQFYRDMLNITDAEILLYTFVINGKKQAVSLCIKYNNIMYAINSGINRDEIPDLNSACTIIKIEEAMKQKCVIYDALMGSFGWKEEWHLNKIPFNKLEKGLA